MKVYFDAPSKHLQGVLADYDHEYVDSISEAEAWVCDPLVAITKNRLRRHKHLKILATPSTGTNHIPLDECEKLGIEVLSLLDNRDALNEITASSEFTLWHILTALRHGGWRQLGSYQRDDDVMRGHELSGKRVGLIGYGRIGQNVRKWLNAMDVACQFYDPFYGKPSVNSIEIIFETSDIVCITCALTEETAHMITWEHLKDFSGILVNTARAEIVDENSLVHWCQKGGRYSTDVLHGEAEGKHLNSPLLEMPNVIVTPHIAGHCFESTEKAARIVLGLLDERNRS